MAKLNKELFKKVIMEAVKELGLCPEEITYTKNNVSYCGIIGKKENVSTEKIQASAIINVDDLYKDYVSDKINITSAIDFAKQLMKCNPDKLDLFEALADWNYAKKRLFISVCGVSGNENYLSKCIHKVYEDIAIVPRYYVSKEGNDIASAPVSIEYFNEYGITEREFFDAAFKNSYELFPARIGKVLPPPYEAVCEDFPMPKEVYDEMVKKYEKNSATFVITNALQLYGAAVVFYSGFLEAVKKDFIKDDFYLIPANVNSMLAVPASGVDGNELPFIKELVCSMNSRIKDKDDILTDSVYFFDGMLKKVA